MALEYKWVCVSEMYSEIIGAHKCAKKLINFSIFYEMKSGEKGLRQNSIECAINELFVANSEFTKTLGTILNLLVAKRDVLKIQINEVISF